MGKLLDASHLVLVDLPLLRYTLHTYGTEADEWPPALSERIAHGLVVQGWEVWCESTDLRERRRG